MEAQMALLALAAATAIFQHAGAPVLWLAPDGRTYIQGALAGGRLSPGTRVVSLNGMRALDFNGANGGVLFGDHSALALTGSMTVSLWLNLRSYVEQGPGAQVLFRGDDRCGADPYTLAVHRDGTIHFGVQQEDQLGRAVTAEIPLGKWVHVLGNFDVERGRLEMWLNGEMVGLATTQWLPFAKLDKGSAPGVSIGNVQNDRGPHNQPLNGMIADLRLYDRVLRPQDLDVGSGGWMEPPKPRTR